MKNTEIQVSLFQQSCMLGGPFSEVALGMIHSISPEKIPPHLTLEQARQALTKLDSATSLPSALEVYSDKLRKRLETQIAFEGSLIESKKLGSTEPIMNALSEKFSVRQRSDLKARLRKIEIKDAVMKWTAVQFNQVREAFDEVLGPHPEEDFHRAIQRLKVRYTCNYGESAGDTE